MKKQRSKSIQKNLSKKNLFRLLNFVLMLLAWAYLYSQIQTHQSFFLQITDLWNKLQKNKAILAIVFGLMFINWILEAKKWQILTKPLAKINLFHSLESVWTGLSLATFLPLGNFLGRAKNLPSTNRFESVGALLVNGAVQFWVTMLGGIYGISQFFEWSNLITFLFLSFWILFYLVGLFFYEKCSLVGTQTRLEKEIQEKEELKKTTFFDNWEVISYIKKYIQKNLYFVSQYTQKDLLQTTFLAFLRYVVFLVQMLLIFKATSFSLATEKIIVGSSLLFAAKSVLPVGGFLVGLSVREATALYFFGALGEEKVITITFLLWIINIGIPVLVGSILLLKEYNKKPKH